MVFETCSLAILIATAVSFASGSWPAPAARLIGMDPISIGAAVKTACGYYCPAMAGDRRLAITIPLPAAQYDARSSQFDDADKSATVVLRLADREAAKSISRAVAAMAKLPKSNKFSAESADGFSSTRAAKLAGAVKRLCVWDGDGCALARVTIGKSEAVVEVRKISGKKKMTAGDGLERLGGSNLG